MTFVTLSRGKRLAITTAAIGLVVVAAAAVPVAQAILDRWYRIPVVRTWRELLDVEPIEVGQGKVRVGIEARSCPAGGGVLLYLLAEHDGPAPYANFGRGLRVWVLQDEARQEDMSPSLKFDAFQPGAQNLFLQAIPACQVGKVEVRIVAPDGEVLRSATLRATGSEYHRWSPLLQDTTPQVLLERQPGQEDEFARSVTAGPCRVAVPGWDGRTPYFPTDVKRGIAEPGLVLPSLFPPEETHGLRLQGENGSLLVSSGEGKIDMSVPEFRFLSRWWLNGVPVQPDEGGPWSFHGRGGLEQIASKLRLRLSFVPNLADARSSDRLGVQLLYLDRGWKFPHQPEFPHTGDPGGRCRALLSNRVELVVP